MEKRVLYLRLEVEAPASYDPMQSLSDVALWAECCLTHGEVHSTVTAYNNAQDIGLDEAEGVFDNKAPRYEVPLSDSAPLL